MAIGISKMFGVNLPINFNSPYKARNIIEFWRRRHITLSMFLRDYLYIPLGGNRKGSVYRYINLLVTMLLGGLWHGANWTFVVWGGLHGVFLCLNYFWQHIFSGSPSSRSKFGRIVATATTFFAVVLTWVIFRAENIRSSLSMIKGMFGLNGISLPVSLSSFGKYVTEIPLSIQFDGVFKELTVSPDLTNFIILSALSFYIVWALPNSQELLEKRRVQCLSDSHLIMSGALIGIFFSASILSLNHVSEFLYFQF